MIRVLLDINVILDLFLNREPWVAESSAVIAANQRREIVASVSAAALPTVFYVIRRNADLARAHAVVAECLDSFDILPVDRATLELARSQPGSDFEDNAQIACAIEARLDAIITRDIKGFAASPVPALSPGDLLAKIATPPDPDPLPG